MKPTVLVITTVHWPDDTRIRERLIRSLAEKFSVEFAAQLPGPSDQRDHLWLPLAGGRLRRVLAALRISLRRDWDLLVVHDPELLPGALLTRWVRRRPVVFDVHENVPATALTREWVPEMVRRPLAWLLARLLRIAERSLEVTLAEVNYRDLFARDHPVFPNFPDSTGYPEPAPGGRSAVYLGDVTQERGLLVAVEASVKVGVPLVLVGRIDEEFEGTLRRLATDSGSLRIMGRLPNAQALASIVGGGVALSPLLDTPNYRYSAPTKIFEYLALGLPVVASDLPGTRQVVGHLEAVELVPPGDVAELGSAMLRSLEPERRQAAVAQAHHVREQFKWPAGDVEAFYLELL